jgi:hypothetical protein
MGVLLSIFVIIVMILAAIGFMVSLVVIFFSKKRELSCACDRAASWQICTEISDPDSSRCKEIKEFIETMNKLKNLFIVPFDHLKAIYLFVKIKTFQQVQQIIPLETLDKFKKVIEIDPEVLQILKELGIDITPEIIKAELGDLPNIDNIQDLLKLIDNFPQLLAEYTQKIDNIIQNVNLPDVLKPYIPIKFLSLIPGLNLPTFPILGLPKIPIMGFVKDLNLENIKLELSKMPELNIPKIPEITLIPSNIDELIDLDFNCKISDVYDTLKESLKTSGGYVEDFAVDSYKKVIGKIG